MQESTCPVCDAVILGTFVPRCPECSSPRNLSAAEVAARRRELATQRRMAFAPTPRTVRGLRWAILILFFGGVAMVAVLCPSWRTFTPLPATTHTNMDREAQRRFLAHDLGHHWLFSAPPSTAGAEVWIDWTTSGTIALLCLIALGIGALDLAVGRRRFAAHESKIRTSGFSQGQHVGRAELLLRLVERRFGPPEDPIHRLILGGTPEDIDRWSERVLTAASVDEMLAAPPDAADAE